MDETLAKIQDELFDLGSELATPEDADYPGMYRVGDAEVKRLEKLGAKRVAKVRTWWVMEAPSGQRFCVVRVQRSDFAENANTWAE